MINFVIGMIVGGCFGVVLMCCVIVGDDEND